MDFTDLIGQLMAAKDKADREKGFDPNPDLFDDFVRIVGFFSKLAKEQDGALDRDAIMPHRKNGDIIVKFNDLILEGDNLRTIANLIEASSGFDLSPYLDGGFDLSITFKNIFKPKS